MQAPLRVLNSLRGDTALGIVLATGLSTAVFAATPIVLPAVAVRFDVSAGTVGLFSAAQLGIFVVASWASGRFLTASASVFRRALLLLAAANLASALTSSFAVLVVVRGASGLSLGVLAWLAWSQVFGDSKRMGDIAVVGPLTVVFVAPLFGLLLKAGDDRHVFLFLLVAGLVPLFKVPDFAPPPIVETAGGRNRAVPQAFVLVAALGLLTLGGSAVFVFGGVIAADRLGLDPLVVSLVYSANAAASIPSARWRGARPAVGGWIIVTATCAVALGSVNAAWMFAGVLIVWGFAFWMAVPGVFTLLSERSRHPAERAGDAQAAMAAGRALGPLLGGLVISAGSYQALGIIGGATMAVAGITCLAVEFGRTANH